MRRKVKKDIKNILQTMCKAHPHVVELMQKKRIDKANDLLSQCQECAFQIGETVEDSVGEGTRMVALLENYCELLYRMSRSEDRKIYKKLKKELDESLRCVESELDKKIPTDKMKIVFMPYKVSMWDCMESVWEAAIEDSECDVYVVPIPYYERNKERELEKLCYEGDAFPQYVSITSYKDFSLEIERPDVIYIHNPYDGANYVSSVHPDYYSSQLKKYTENLIYIPYFFMGDGAMPETHCNLPAYVYSDKIIVQDREKAESLSDFVPEDKIAVIGSPKVDRILKLEKSKNQIIENDIPKEWKERMEGRKVILFNVSISGILQNSKYAMDKIRYVLSCFRERDDVVLFWRPHPLIEATLKTMRPELYREYIEIKKDFQYSKKGILDETGDAGIAAMLADAYLGELSSSLVHYFGVLRKPVLFIDWRILEYKDENRNSLLFLDCEREDNYLFFIPYNKGIGQNLYRLDIENGNMEKYLTLSGIPDNITKCYSCIKRINNKWILVPYNAEDVYVYDIDRNQGIKLVLTEQHDGAELFGGAVEYQGKLYLTPMTYSAIVQIDVENMAVHEFKECFISLNHKNETKHSFAYLKKEEYLYLASSIESVIVIFNMESEDYEIKKIGNYTYGYSDMIYDGSYFWLTVREGKDRTCGRIIRWDEKSGNAKEYTYPIGGEERLNNEEWNWCQLVDRGEELAVIDYFLQDIILLDKKSGECRKDKNAGKMIRKIKKGLTEKKLGFSLRMLDAQNVWLMDGVKRCNYIWNMPSNQWKSISCRISRDELRESDNRNINKYALVKTTPYHLLEGTVPVPRYIDYIADGDISVFETAYTHYGENVGEGTIGAAIHKYIKERCILG